VSLRVPVCDSPALKYLELPEIWRFYSSICMLNIFIPARSCDSNPLVSRMSNLLQIEKATTPVGNQESDKVKGTSGANGQTCEGQKESYADVAKRGTTCDVDSVISKRVRFAEKAKNERPSRPVILFDNPIVRKV